MLKLLFWSIWKIVGFCFIALFLFMGWLGLTHEEVEDVNAFCEAQCDRNSPDFMECMDSCFLALGGSGLFQVIFLMFGLIGLFIAVFYIWKKFENLTTKP